MAPKVLFVCIGNSCRSQMAEGFAHALGLEAWSAGSKPAGAVNPAAIAAMKERGIDISWHRSKGLADLPKHDWDYVITMGCGDACPFVASRAKADWGLPDPVGRPLPEFRRIRDEIERKVRELAAEARAA